MDISLEGSIVEAHVESPLEGDKCEDIWDNSKLARGMLANKWEKVSAPRQRMHDPDLTRRVSKLSGCPV